jgi:hypothetical protein
MSTNWKIKYGDFLTKIKSKYKIILQANNSLTTKSHEISKELNNIFPYCRPYEDRKNKQGYKNLAIIKDRATVGSIKCFKNKNGPTIISLFCCYDFGKPSHKHHRPQLVIPDNQENRLKWLTLCLDRIYEIYPPNTEFFIPYKMLCGLGGLEWKKVKHILQNWAIKYNYYITCYKLK